MQVANLGLVKAVDRFDPDRGVQFSTFATATILGELKRHFRDRTWAIRVPRRLQEGSLAVNRAVTELYQELARSPTVSEVAKRTGLNEEGVLESMEALQAYSTASLDAPDQARVLARVYVQPAEVNFPVYSWWRLEWRKGADGRWRMRLSVKTTGWWGI